MEYSGNSFVEDAASKFNSLSDELIKLLHGRREGDKEYINALFDDLNALNYKQPIITNPEKALLLLHACCGLVAPSDTLLAAKAAQVASRAVGAAARRGARPEGATLTRALLWTAEALRSTALLATPDLLSALEALLRANAGARLERLMELVGPEGVLAPLLNSPSAAQPAPPPLRCLTPPPPASARRDLRVRALRCLDACLGTLAAGGETPGSGARKGNPGGVDALPPEVVVACEEVFERVLREPRDKDDAWDEEAECLRSQMLSVCLRGLRGCVARASAPPSEEKVGRLLALATAHLGYGLGPPGAPAAALPDRLFPSPLPPGPALRTPPPQGPAKQPTKNVRMRNRFKKADPARRGGGDGDDGGGGGGSGGGGGLWGGNAAGGGWSGDETSSGGSDAEGGGFGGGAGAVAGGYARVRLSAVLLVLALAWRAQRRDLLAYWPWVLGTELQEGGCVPLARAAARDPSARVRAEAATTLSAALAGAKPFLRLAENKDRGLNSSSEGAFTAFSSALGGALRELHRELSGALFREEVPAAATQLLRCLASLLQGAPYRRLAPGLPALAARHARPFTQHRDGAVQVAAFTVLRSVAAAEAPDAELLAALRHLPRPGADPDAPWAPPLRPAVGPEGAEGGDVGDDSWDEEEVAPEDEEEFMEKLRGEQPKDEAEAARETLARALRLSAAPGGGERPCWLVAACLRRLAPSAAAACVSFVLRVEVLLTLRAVALRFFDPLLRPHLHTLLLPGLMSCMQESTAAAVEAANGQVAVGGDSAVRLHATRALEAVGTALAKDEEGQEASPLASPDARAFWLRLLQLPAAGKGAPATVGAPLPALLATGDEAERAAALDLLAAMHPAAYAALPRREQLLALSLPDGALEDDNPTVRAAAARALGVSAAFRAARLAAPLPPDFLWARASRLARALATDTSAIARARLAWALSEVSDALMEETRRPDTEDPSTYLAELMEMLEAVTKGAADVDKVRSHAVRAVGNVLRLLPAEALSLCGDAGSPGGGGGGGCARRDAGPAAERALAALAAAAETGSLMKPRWNACYALASAARNQALFQPKPRWQESALPTLLRLLQRCENFKVRTAAAAALTAAASGAGAETEGAGVEAAAAEGRRRLGAQLVPAWAALLAAAERARAPTDPEEAAHRDALLEQLALAAAAVATAAAASAASGGPWAWAELGALREFADPRAEAARAAAAAALRARPPERATPLLAAAEALRARARDPRAPPAAREHARALRAIFVPEGEADGETASGDAFTSALGNTDAPLSEAQRT